ncbi:MAG TPA: rhodanese-like domain-containing protein [Vicinamibacterales bacterium]|nr:rhodanese-like domain-containing protein [Vicinamibacterales bacterium]
MFQRFFDEGLAQASFLIASDRTREAVVVDPRRDIDVYVDAARQHGLTLTHAVETHIHADFVSGARELATLGARVVCGPGSDLHFAHQAVRQGDELRVGDLQLAFAHTPGHTPEHIAILVREPDQPARVLTGDTLFVGAVGRPDLLGADLMQQLAHQLYHSLYGTLLGLDNAVEVHPGHGAGSLCGAGIGQAPHSTIGQERRFNPMLQHASEEAFVAAVLGDLPETPPYFPRMKRINREGPPLVGLGSGVTAPPSLSATRAAAVIRDGGLLLDLRGGDAFAAGHPAGALNIGFGTRVGYWAGWLISPHDRLVLLLDDERQAPEVRRQLLRIGLDDVEGTIAGGFDAWREAGLPLSRIGQVTPDELQRKRAVGRPLTVVDVRSPGEWRAGHLEGAVNIPVGELASRAGSLDRSSPVATICEGGFRSSLAASILARAGVPVVNVAGGMAAHRATELKSRG